MDNCLNGSLGRSPRLGAVILVPRFWRRRAAVDGRKPPSIRGQRAVSKEDPQIGLKSRTERSAALGGGGRALRRSMK
jgi:hypothetical protein